MICTNPAKSEIMITIVLNGKSAPTAARDLNELVANFNAGSNRVATALNGAFVPANARATTMLKDGDRVEILSPRQGG